MSFRMGDTKTRLHDDENNLKGMKLKKGYLKEQRKPLSGGNRSNPGTRMEKFTPNKKRGNSSTITHKDKNMGANTGLQIYIQEDVTI